MCYIDRMEFFHSFGEFREELVLTRKLGNQKGKMSTITSSKTAQVFYVRKKSVIIVIDSMA